jgi:hypothetical protein
MVLAIKRYYFPKVIYIVIFSVFCEVGNSFLNVIQNLTGEVKGGRRVGLKILPTYVSRLSRQNVGASTF